jgi:hypothetical protein
MLRRLVASTGLSAAALLATTPAATAESPAETTDDGVGLTYGITTTAVDMTTGVAGGALEIAGLDRR